MKGDGHFGPYHFGSYHFGPYHFGPYHFGSYHFGPFFLEKILLPLVKTLWGQGSLSAELPLQSCYPPCG